MAKRYHLETGGSRELPISDSTVETDLMSAGDAYGECYIAFYDEAGEVVAPSAGTALFESAAIDGQFLTAGDPIDVTMCGPDATYTPPSFNSTAVRTRLTLSGVTGASYARAFHWRGR